MILHHFGNVTDMVEDFSDDNSDDLTIVLTIKKPLESARNRTEQKWKKPSNYWTSQQLLGFSRWSECGDLNSITLPVFWAILGI